MKYTPPFGATNPEEVYVNRNLGTGTRGSKVDAKFFNMIQAELLNLLAAVDIEQDEEDLTQVYQAILAIVEENIIPGGDMFKADNLSGLVDLILARENIGLGNDATGRANMGILQRRGTSIASAATTDIGSADSHYVQVTGNTTITSLGTGVARDFVMVEFTGTTIITHHASNLILPGSANITTQVGDRAIFVRRGAAAAAQWLCLSYQRADGRALVAPPPIKYARLVHELAQGSTWINYSAGSWQTALLNTEEEDVDGIVTLASNQFTLQPGTYDVEAILSVYSSGTVDPVARLYNVTDGAEVGGRGLNDKNQANVTMKGFNGHRWFFTIAAAKTFRVEVYCKTASTAQPTFNVSSFTERMNMVHIKKYA